MVRYLFPLLALLVAESALADRAPEAPWGAIVVGRQSTAERLATVDLQRYLGQVTGAAPVLVTDVDWLAHPRPAVLLGTPSTNRALRVVGARAEALDEEGYRLETLAHGSVGAWGEQPAGAVNAVYGLLRELGYGFYLGSESLPESLPPGLAGGPVVRRPALRVRGVLPWYNFLNSPTTWDPTDHRALADQLIRMGANFVGFHTYDAEPFAAYEQDGKMVWGARLLSTTGNVWGTTPLTTDRFGFGTGLLYPGEAFGAATALAGGPDDEAIRREQEVMRDALQYAHDRGLKTCLGFELGGDPTDPTWRGIFTRRLEWLLDHYPSLDYIWLWQAETQGASGYAPQPSPRVLPDGRLEGSRMPLYGMDRQETFRRVVDRQTGERPFFQDTEAGRLARATEGARLEQFGTLASKLLARREHAPRLVISGWGGDERILSAEYYEGLDRLLPEDVVFSSLEHIAARPRVDRIYHDLPAGRERWPIPWLECDGDEWHAQPRVHDYEGAMRDLLASGSQGVLGIHWRTRDVEENLGYLVDAAWEPSLTAEAFFTDYARRVYGPDLGPTMAAIHSELDVLGYRWLGGAGQNECAPFSWGPGEPAKAARLGEIRAQVAALLPESGRHGAKVAWLLDSLDWVLAYDRAERDALEATALIARARGADAEEASRVGREALAVLARTSFSEALWAYARRVTTRGEYGVLATVNGKAVVAWRALQAEAGAVAGAPLPEEPGPPEVTPAIFLPRFPGCADAGADLVLEPYILGGARGWLHYRAIGQPAWSTLPLRAARGWVREGRIPAAEIRAPGIEIALSFSRSAADPFAWGPVGVTVLPDGRLSAQPSPEAPSGAPEALTAQADVTPLGLVRVAWNDLAAADYYRVLRDGAPIGETVVAYLPDAPIAVQGAYEVEAWRGAELLARSAPISYRVPDVPVQETPTVVAKAGRLAVLLSWPRCDARAVAWYEVRRAPDDGAGAEVTVARIAASHVADHRAKDSPAAGRWVYRVVPISLAGREGAGTTVSVALAPGPVPPPVLSLPLDARPEGAEVHGAPEFGPDGMRSAAAWLRLPHRAEWNLGGGMTIELRFRADDTASMPVLLSHGAWQVDGWFVQVLGGRLLLRTPQGDATGPAVEPGVWYTVRFVYDGMGFRVWCNGAEVPQTEQCIIDVPCARDLIVGQYEAQQPMYQFRGALRDLRLWNDAVLPDEVP